MPNFDQSEISKIDIKQTSVLEFQTNAFTASLTIYFWQCTVYSASSTNHLTPSPPPCSIAPKWLSIHGVCILFCTKIQGLCNDFQGHISHFWRTPFSAKKSPCLCYFNPQHEQFYPEGLAPFPLGWIKLAPKFKDFPATTAIFMDFQGACKPCIQLGLTLYMHACMTMNHGIPLFICRLWPFWRKSFRFDTSFPDFFFKVGSWKKQVQ